LIFDAIDTNNDGGIGDDEFANYFSSFGITDTAVSKSIFKAMDTNGDGSLDKSGIKKKLLLLIKFRFNFLNFANFLEFAAFGIDFFLNTDPNAPSRLFFGPLL
jgi:hypothetical protein